MNDMTKGNIVRQLVVFAVPVFIGNVFQCFYNVVDAVVVGQFLGVEALAAVGALGSLMFLITGVMLGFANGFGISISQAFGAKDSQKLRHYVAMSCVLCISIVISFMTVCLVANEKILELLNIQEDIYYLAKNYISIIYMGLPAIMLYNILAAIARGMGDSRTPLYFLVLSSVLNIILDIAFVGYLRIGVEGAALATVISQGVAGGICFVYVAKKYKEIHFTKADVKINIGTCKTLLSLGMPMALQYTIIAMGGLTVQATLNQLGSIYIAAISTSSKIETLLCQGYMAIGVALANFTGQNYGARQIARVKSGVKYAVIMGSIIVVIIMIITYFFASEFIVIFVDNPSQEMKELVRQVFHIYLWFYPCHAVLNILCNAFQGVGKGVVSMYSGIAELLARFIAAVFIFPHLGFVAICLAGPLAWLFAFLLLVPYWVTYQKKLVC
ncbi:MAG: MATE family efflux transporter [Eubacteriales bacterium]